MLRPVAILMGGSFYGIAEQDEKKGKLHQAKGLVKGKIGRSLGNRKMKAEGDAERARGQIREGFGKSRRRVGRDGRKDRQSDRKVNRLENGKIGMRRLGRRFLRCGIDWLRQGRSGFTKDLGL